MSQLNEKRMGNALVAMINATEVYCAAYRAEFQGDAVGTDGILGDLGVKLILEGLENLLNGPRGEQDGAILSRAINEIRERHELTDL